MTFQHRKFANFQKDRELVHYPSHSFANSVLATNLAHLLAWRYARDALEMRGVAWAAVGFTAVWMAFGVGDAWGDG